MDLVKTCFFKFTHNNAFYNSLKKSEKIADAAKTIILLESITKFAGNS